MSKNYKQKHEKKDNIKEEITENSLSKKELYDLNKKKKKNKETTKKNKKKKDKKTYKTNLAGRIFAIIMLLLMAGSVLATISYYFTSAAR